MSVHSRIPPNRCWLAGLVFAPVLALAAPLAYVTGGTYAVSVMDTATNRIVATVPNAGRGAIAANAAGTRVYVGNAYDLSVIDTATNAVVGKVALDEAANGIAVHPDGTRAFVASGDNGMGSPNGFMVSVVDLTTNTIVARIPVAPFLPKAIAVNRTGTRVYVAASGLGFSPDQVWVIDAASYEVLTRIAIPGGAANLAMSQIDSRLYVTGTAWNAPMGSLAVIDTATHSIVATTAVGPLPAGVAVGARGTRVYVSTYSSGLWVFDAGTLDAIVTLSVGTNPGPVTADPGGARIYVANYDSNDVSVIDAASNSGVATIAMPAPTGIVVTVVQTVEGEAAEAVEYYHEAFEHYFVTADPAEIDVLDSGALPGWWRTGQSYRVYDEGAAGRAPVCRFYTDAFEGKPSHFFTASADECEQVKQLPQWIFEGIAFYVRVPDPDGNCAAGSTSVYRLYNAGRGGAPNHAYTPDGARRDRLGGAGWIVEGTAWCAPLARANPPSQTLLLADTTWELPVYGSTYGAQTRTTFDSQLADPPSAQWPYLREFGLSDPVAVIAHKNGGLGPAGWNGYAYYDPLTGRFVITAKSAFGDRSVWEFDNAMESTSAACYFKVKPNPNPVDPMAPHPFQPVLWTGCINTEVNRL